ncbi:MAG: 4Fe-4S dicluster domain-containing protein [Terriglobales bacterium]
MKKWSLIVDVALCENCNNCMLVTKDEHVGNDFPGYAAPQPRHGHYWVKLERKVRGSGSMVDAAHMPVMCNHCDHAPCIQAARDGAIYKRPDGIVIIDPHKAKGRKDLVQSCPYGAIWWNEELELPQKWIFDAHLLDQGWKKPRVTQTCPTGVYRAIHAEDSEMAQIVREEKLEVLRPELGTAPRVYYKNYYRFSKCFIGGSVVAKVNGMKECVEGAKAVLSRSGKVVANAATDLFGDFKFDHLDPNSGVYRVEVSHAKFGKAVRDVQLTESQYLGKVDLETAA